MSKSNETDYNREVTGLYINALQAKNINLSKELIWILSNLMPTGPISYQSDIAALDMIKKTKTDVFVEMSYRPRFTDRELRLWL